MLRRPYGVMLLAVALVTAGVAGVVAFSVAFFAWLTTVSFSPLAWRISPLAWLSSLAWSCTFFVAAGLTWRRSRFAAPAFLAASALMAPLVFFILPGNVRLILAFYTLISILALLGFRYLRTAELSSRVTGNSSNRAHR